VKVTVTIRLRPGEAEANKQQVVVHEMVKAEIMNFGKCQRCRCCRWGSGGNKKIGG
jgi:hypothetical protein